MAICPICKQEYSAPPATSRVDNKTPICPACGVRQALDAAGICQEAQEEIVRTVSQSYGS